MTQYIATLSDGTQVRAVSEGLLTRVYASGALVWLSKHSDGTEAENAEWEALAAVQEIEGCELVFVDGKWRSGGLVRVK